MSRVLSKLLSKEVLSSLCSTNLMPLTVKQASRPDSKKKAVVVPDVMMITFDVLQRYFLRYVSYAYAPTCTRKLLSFFSPHAGPVRRNLLVLMPREMKSYTTFVVRVTAGLVTSANYVFAHTDISSRFP
jgi:hypothetical protein